VQRRVAKLRAHHAACTNTAAGGDSQHSVRCGRGRSSGGGRASRSRKPHAAALSPAACLAPGSTEAPIVVGQDYIMRCLRHPHNIRLLGYTAAAVADEEGGAATPDAVRVVRAG
jgi:hypothetical protein